MLLQNIPEIKRYVGIDVLPGYVTSKQCQRREVPRFPGSLLKGKSYGDKFQLIVKRNGSLDLGPEDLPPCNVAFIDGDHGFATVLHDTALAHRIVQPGGLIIWHDYNTTGKVDVKPVLDALRLRGDDISNVAGTWFAFQRR